MFQKGDYVILVDAGPMGGVTGCWQAEGSVAKVVSPRGGLNKEFLMVRWLGQKNGHGGYYPKRFELLPGPW